MRTHEVGPSFRPGRAALLGLFLFADTYGIAALLFFFLPTWLHLHLSFGGGPVAAGAAAFVLLVQALAGIAGLLVATSGPALLAWRRRSCSWRAICRIGALGFVPSLATVVFVGDAYLVIVLPVLAGAALLGAAGLLRPRWPLRTTAAAPLLGLVVGLLWAAHGWLADWSRSKQSEVFFAVQDGDEAKVQHLLDGVVLRWAQFDLDEAIALAFRKARPALGLAMARHPAAAHSPCAAQVDAFANGRGTREGLDTVTSDCCWALAEWMAVQGRTADVARIASRVPPEDGVAIVLRELLVAWKNREAARRFLEAGGYLDGRGKIAARHYEPYQVAALFSSVSNADDALLDFADGDALAFRLATYSRDSWRVVHQLVLRGTSPNAVNGCGVSLLMAHLTSPAADAAWVKALLDDGADPDRAARSDCGQPMQAPLALVAWWLTRAAYLDGKTEEIARALLVAGADAKPLREAAKALPPRLRDEVRDFIDKAKRAGE